MFEAVPFTAFVLRRNLHTSEQSFAFQPFPIFVRAKIKTPHFPPPRSTMASATDSKSSPTPTTKPDELYKSLISVPKPNLDEKLAEIEKIIGPPPKISRKQQRAITYRRLVHREREKDRQLLQLIQSEKQKQIEALKLRNRVWRLETIEEQKEFEGVEAEEVKLDLDEIEELGSYGLSPCSRLFIRNLVSNVPKRWDNSDNKVYCTQSTIKLTEGFVCPNDIWIHGIHDQFATAYDNVHAWIKLYLGKRFVLMVMFDGIPPNIDFLYANFLPLRQIDGFGPKEYETIANKIMRRVKSQVMRLFYENSQGQIRSVWELLSQTDAFSKCFIIFNQGSNGVNLAGPNVKAWYDFAFHNYRCKILFMDFDELKQDGKEPVGINCKDCGKRERRVVFKPCSHMLICEECALPDRCGLCDAKIEAYDTSIIP